MSTDWNKHFYEQVINKGNYDTVDQTVLEELFRMLTYEIHETDEDGELSGQEELIKAYSLILDEYLIPDHYSVVRKIQEDMKRELLQEEPHAQA